MYFILKEVKMTNKYKISIFMSWMLIFLINNKVLGQQVALPCVKDSKASLKNFSLQTLVF